VHAPFGDHFAVEMRHFFKEPDILQQRGPAVSVFWLSGTGAPNAVVSLGLLVISIS